MSGRNNDIAPASSGPVEESASSTENRSTLAHPDEGTTQQNNIDEQHSPPNTVKLCEQRTDVDSLEDKNSEITESLLSSPFDCNICFDPLSEPVVTLCGHLYCWPCLYRWLEPGILPHERQIFHRQRHDRSGEQQVVVDATGSSVTNINRSRRCCPVCKSRCSITTVVPIYVRNDISCKRRKKIQKPSSTKSNGTRTDTTLLNEDATSVSSEDAAAVTSVPSRPRPQVSSSSNTRERATTSASSGAGVVPNNVATHAAPPASNEVPSLTSLTSSFHQSFFPGVAGGQSLQNNQAVPTLHRPTQPDDAVHREVSSQSSLAHEEISYTAVEDATTEFLSRLLLMLGSFVVFCLLLF